MSKESSSNSNRLAGVNALILSSLADGAKHGYALTQDIEQFASVRVSAGTLYEALARLEKLGLIEPAESIDRRRPYRLTAEGAAALSDYLAEQARLVAEGQRRLKSGWNPA